VEADLSPLTATSDVAHALLRAASANESLSACYPTVEQFNWTTPMQLVAVKNKFQIVIPQSLREQIGISVGDMLEAKVERGKITFTPKSVVDRGIAESLADFEARRSYGPFKSADALITSLHKESAKLTARKKAKRAPRK
jgi:AbrB family looped-hinge helix DNA binding protein